MSRLRVIAGPNGSGKSSIFEKVRTFKEKDKVISTGKFINSDEIEKLFDTVGFVKLDDFNITNAPDSLIDDYLQISTLQNPYSPEIIQDLIFLENNCLKLRGKSSPLLGMIVSDLIREELLKRGNSFTMETVFSHPDKVAFMQRAKDKEYKVYFYFVSTANPEINIKRVEGRVAAGGHDVPKDKIVNRYYRTMENLYEAVKISYRAYIFDNSGSETVQVAEKDKNNALHLESSVPEWVLKYLRIDQENL